jgi:hypothetical protein
MVFDLSPPGLYSLYLGTSRNMTFGTYNIKTKHEPRPHPVPSNLTYEEWRAALTRQTVRSMHVLSETEIGQSNVRVIPLASQ